MNGPGLFRVRPKIITLSSTIMAGSARRSPRPTSTAPTMKHHRRLMTGQHSDPLRVVMFNPDTDRAEDVSHAIAQEILRRLGLEGRNVPSGLENFIDRHVGRDRQLTLRLALT